MKKATDLVATLKSHYIKNGMPKWSTLEGDVYTANAVCLLAQIISFSVMALQKPIPLYSGG